MRSIRAELALFRRRLGRVVQSVLPGIDVLWSAQNTAKGGDGSPAPGRAWVELALSPPRQTAIAARRAEELPSSVRITVTGMTGQGDRLAFVNGVRVSATAATDPAMAAALAQAIASSQEPVSATPQDNTVTVTRQTMGDLRSLRALPEELMEAEVLATEHVEIVETPAISNLSVNVYSCEGAGEHDASGILAELLIAIRDYEVATALANIQCALGMPGFPRDLSALEGAEVESRAQVDIPVSLVLRRARAIDPVETVAINTAQGGFEVHREG